MSRSRDAAETFRATHGQTRYASTLAAARLRNCPKERAMSFSIVGCGATHHAHCHVQIEPTVLKESDLPGTLGSGERSCMEFPRPHCPSSIELRLRKHRKCAADEL